MVLFSQWIRKKCVFGFSGFRFFCSTKFVPELSSRESNLCVSPWFACSIALESNSTRVLWRFSSSFVCHHFTFGLGRDFDHFRFVLLFLFSRINVAHVDGSRGLRDLSLSFIWLEPGCFDLLFSSSFSHFCSLSNWRREISNPPHCYHFCPWRNLFLFGHAASSHSYLDYCWHFLDNHGYNLVCRCSKLSQFHREAHFLFARPRTRFYVSRRYKWFWRLWASRTLLPLSFSLSLMFALFVLKLWLKTLRKYLVDTCFIRNAFYRCEFWHHWGPVWHNCSNFDLFVQTVDVLFLNQLLLEDVFPWDRLCFRESYDLNLVKSLHSSWVVFFRMFLPVKDFVLKFPSTLVVKFQERLVLEFQWLQLFQEVDLAWLRSLSVPVMLLEREEYLHQYLQLRQDLLMAQGLLMVLDPLDLSFSLTLMQFLL